MIWSSEVDGYLSKWQKRLGLSDWHITIKIRDARDMDQYPARATIQENIQCADIRVMDINDRQQSDPGYADLELDIVHELIHIRLWAIDPKDIEGSLHTCREQAIEWIARALIETDRNSCITPPTK